MVNIPTLPLSWRHFSLTKERRHAHEMHLPAFPGELNVKRNVLDESPVYQRESGLWSQEKQQLFIDSLFNDFDVPKLYFHDVRGKHATKHFAIVDGKQRLHAVWEFLSGRLPTASDFSVADDLGQPPAPSGAIRFPDLPALWQETFKAKSLPVVLIQNAEDEDIEELFFRLNNGEPLNAAEKRNALGGAMNELIREVAKEDFFTKYLTVPSKRYQHLEVAAKLIILEKTEADGSGIVCDLKKRFLDKMVEDNKHIPSASRVGIEKRVDENLKLMKRVFHQKDALLSKQAYPPLYYIWTKLMHREYGHVQLYSRLRDFLESFQAQRASNLNLPEDKRDAVLVEFGRLMQQGTNDIGSLQSRVAILRRYFLQQYPDVRLKDATRSFTEEERYAIWILGGKQCAVCSKALADLDEMEADHKLQWAHGGETTLENGRSLCESCNRTLATKVA